MSIVSQLWTILSRKLQRWACVAFSQRKTVAGRLLCRREGRTVYTCSIRVGIVIEGQDTVGDVEHVACNCVVVCECVCISDFC